MFSQYWYWRNIYSVMISMHLFTAHMYTKPAVYYIWSFPSQEMDVSGIKFTAYNAGHVLGAAMFLIEIAGVKVRMSNGNTSTVQALCSPHVFRYYILETSHVLRTDIWWLLKYLLSHPIYWYRYTKYIIYNIMCSTCMYIVWTSVCTKCKFCP